MYMDDMKLFTKKEKNRKPEYSVVEIYCENLGIESGIEKYALLIMKSGNRLMKERIELPN